MDDDKHPFVVVLDRPRKTADLRRRADLELSARNNQDLTEGFKKSLDRVIDDEGLRGDVDRISATSNLPMLVVVGTERLAERVRRMDGVRRVARDGALPVQGGYPQLV